MADCLIGLGSNMGDRAAHLDLAIKLLGSSSHVTSCRHSGLVETSPIGGPGGQQPYLNSALRVTTTLSPVEILAWTRQVEQDMGRRRLERWGPRTIDIDVLLYDLLILNTPDLELPHPRMAMRRFVLQPACEVAADMIHAPTGWSLRQLLDRLDHSPQYVAVCCADRRCSARLAAAAADQLNAHHLSVAAHPHPLGDETQATGAQVATSAARQAALEALANQVDLLRSIAPNEETAQKGELFVSDFWLNQSLALARSWEHGVERERLQQACESAIQTAPQPRFILHLDMRSSAPPLLEPYRLQLRRQLAVTHQGPVLNIPAADQERALIELRAGIDAMQ